jgi:hypothetical protein
VERQLTPEEARGGGGEQPPFDSALQSSIGTASSRIQVVIEAAEKAAAGIIDDAEAQARSYLEESRRRADMISGQRAREVASMTDALIVCAEEAKRQSDELLAVLDQGRLRVDQALQVHLPEKPRSHDRGLEAAAEALSGAQQAPLPAPLVQGPPPPAAQPPIEPLPVQPPPPVEPPPAAAPPLSQPPPVAPGPSREEPPVGAEWWTTRGLSRPDA